MPHSRLDIALGRSRLSLPEQGRIAVLRARPDTDHSVLPGERLQLFNGFRPDHDRLAAAGYAVAARPPQGQEFAAVLVEITRSKDETKGLIAQALEMVGPGGVVLVDGARTDGIDSVLRHCRAILPIDDVLIKHHGRLFRMTRPDELPDEIRVWADALALRPNRDGFLTAPGMFSPDHIDAGSALLARHFDARLGGNVADLGAGWGWLAIQALKAGQIERIDLFEAEDAALTAARANIDDPRARFFWADVTAATATAVGQGQAREQTLEQTVEQTLGDGANRPADTPLATYDAVICNPPFHQGRAATPALGQEFIRRAHGLLAPDGALWLVANRQMPYESILRESFGQVTPLEENSAFKAILASKPIAGAPGRGHRRILRAR